MLPISNIFFVTVFSLSYASKGFSLSEMELDALLFQCCNFGLNLATSRNCSSFSTNEIKDVSGDQQRVCSSTLQLCCARKLRELDCESGKTAAQNGEVCSPGVSPDDENCCEACKLGLMTGTKISSCNLGRVNLGTLWGAAYQSCCRNTDKYQPLENGSENMCELLQGELCAHNCHFESGSYRCSCRPGYVLLPDGKSCEEDHVDKCQTSENHCSQQCHSSGNIITCSCFAGYRLAGDNISCIRTADFKNSRCEIGYKYNFTTRLCTDVNECYENNPCKIESEDCYNTEGSYRCAPKKSCSPGFRFNTKKKSCEDIDECEDERPCDSTQICTNTVGSYACYCRTGYQVDDMTLGCLDINECQTNQALCRTGERCDNTVGSYLCVRSVNCGTGYTLNAGTGKCEDNDECAMGTHDCHLAGPDRVCVNLQGSFRCVRRGMKNYDSKCPNNNCNPIKLSCPRGYRSINGMCSDINECAEGLYSCNPNEVCVNTLGAYRCTKLLNCEPGFKLSADRRTCIDIDECSERLDICSQSCINLYGTYTCGCNPGFKLDTDNRTCVDVNECEMSGRLCLGICVNEPGSYSCSCPKGYRLSPDKINCEDIDECREPDTCQDVNEICLNMRGTYRCVQVNCPAGYEKDPSRKNRCRRIDNRCVNQDGCKNEPLSYTTSYIAITSNMTIPPSGIDVFNLKGPLYSSTSVRFGMELSEVLAPPHVKAATKQNFMMRMSGHNQCIISIVKPIEGPQDVLLKISMDFYNSGIYGGTTISNLEIYVSQYSF